MFLLLIYKFFKNLLKLNILKIVFMVKYKKT